MFNSAQCTHELLSIPMLVRIHLGFQNIFVVNDSWHLLISCSKFNSTANRMNDQRTSYGTKGQTFIKITVYD